MVFPWGDVVMFREYYDKTGIVPTHAKKIAELSGNEVKKVGTYIDKKSRASFDKFEEQMVGERFRASVLDSRSFASPGSETDRTIGMQYNHYGLKCRASKGWRNEKIVPEMLAMLKPDPDKPHIMHEFWKRGIITEERYQKWLKARKGDYKRGCRLYFTYDLNHIFREINKWSLNPKTGRPNDEFDHLAGGALKYCIAENMKFWGDPSKLHYRGDSTLREVEPEEEAKPKSPYKFIKGY